MVEVAPVLAYYHVMKSENYLQIITNPAERITLTKLILGENSLPIQTEKYHNKRAPIQEERTCLICNKNYTEDEQHFLMYYQRYDL